MSVNCSSNYFNSSVLIQIETDKLYSDRIVQWPIANVHIRFSVDVLIKVRMDEELKANPGERTN